MVTAVKVKRILVKDFRICFRSTDKKRMYRSNIKNTSISLEDTKPRGLITPKNSPKSAEAIIIMGCNLPIRLIVMSHFL